MPVSPHNERRVFLAVIAWLGFHLTGLANPEVYADDVPEPVTTPGRDVYGTLTQNGQPVERAAVTLCNADTGVPLVKGLRRTPTWQEHRMTFEDLWCATTDDSGEFEIENVPPGRYRLMAQTWRDVGEFEHPFDVRDHDLQVLGSVEFEVTEADAVPLDVEFVAAPGTNRLVIDGDIDEVSLILESSELPEDAALGPFAMSGPFATHLLGFCRGRLTIEGLPDGTIGVVIFILDNSPGVNTYSLEVAEGGTARIEVREEDMLAGWSNARRGPLPGLEAEMEEVTTLFDEGSQESLWNLLTADTAAAGTSYDGLFDLSDHERALDMIPQLGDLRRAITLPSGHETTVGKVVAAMTYHEMAQRE